MYFRFLKKSFDKPDFGITVVRTNEAQLCVYFGITIGCLLVYSGLSVTLSFGLFKIHNWKIVGALQMVFCSSSWRFRLRIRLGFAY